MIKSQLKYVTFGVMLFSNLTSELNAGFGESCKTTTTTINNSSCPTACGKSEITQGECTAWGWYCPNTPGTGTSTIYKGVCVKTGSGWRCENLAVIRSTSFTCRC